MKVRVYEGDIKVQSFVLGNIHPHLTLPTTTVNSWLVHLPQGRLLIDAGPPWAGRPLARELIRRGLEPNWVALTHAHIDHAGGICDLLKLIPSARFLAQEADIPVLTSGEVLVPSFINPFTPIRPAIHWAFTRRPMPRCHPDGDLGELAELGIEVLQTPGHSLPHASLLLPDGSLMAGDALAVNPAGRPVVNAFYEDQDLMLESLQILARRGSGRVFAGHGVPCSIEQVRALVENTIHSGPKKPLKRKTI